MIDYSALCLDCKQFVYLSSEEIEPTYTGFIGLANLAKRIHEKQTGHDVIVTLSYKLHTEN